MLFLTSVSLAGTSHYAWGEEYLASLYQGDEGQGGHNGHAIKTSLPCIDCLAATLNFSAVQTPDAGPVAGGPSPLAEVPGGASVSGDGLSIFKRQPSLSGTGQTTPVLGLFLMLGVHELGHMIEADYSRVQLDWRGGVLIAHTENREKLARLAGAGLVFQNFLGGMDSFLPVESGLARSVRVASALNRLGYVAFPESLLKDGGDVKTLDNTGRGGDFLKGALVISALADLYKALNPDDRWDLNFWQSSKGTPGLLFVFRM
jgi:hypothetical protein